MSGPNERRANLPPSMYLRAGRYYLVKRDRTTKKLVWTALSKDLDEALQQYRTILGDYKLTGHVAPISQPEHWLRRVARKLHERARRGAEARNLAFALTVEDVYQLGVKAGWRCQVTGIAFRVSRPEGTKRRAFMPSIDRIDSSAGYTADNCRMVCVITNIALGDWGEEPFAEMAESYVRFRMQAGNARDQADGAQAFYSAIKDVRRQAG